VRSLGSSKTPVTILALGGFHVGGRKSEKEAVALVDTALEEGIRFFDNAESYQSGRAERWMGSALKGARKEVFLMSKTFSLDDRSAESAKRHLDGTLERLQTDYLDLWQLHSLRSERDCDRAFRKGGAMEYILEQKEKGVVRHVGVTGHVNPKANLRALKHFDEGMKFECMQFPLNPMDEHQLSFRKALVPELQGRRPPRQRQGLLDRRLPALCVVTSRDGCGFRNGNAGAGSPKREACARRRVLGR
jgi:aryl-alcohol dehydrogenase-like predicted oxidoreductase